MKKLIASALALAPFVMPAAESPTLAFPDEKIGIPPLSLADSAKQGALPLLGNSAASFRSQEPARPAPRTLVSNMPIIPPAPGVEYHLRIITPDESVDYKMIVKAPDVEPAK